MSHTTDNYLREVESTLRVDASQRNNVIAELRAHIHDKIEDTMRADPTRVREEVEREVIADFGSPRDLALAYGDTNTLVNRTTGEVVLELSKRVGRETGKVIRTAARGTGNVLKWVAVAMAVLLIFAIGLGVWAFYELKPLVEQNVPVPVFTRSDDCRASPCNITLADQGFYVHPDAREVRLDLSVHHTNTSLGAFTISVMNANGTIVYQEDFPANGTHRMQLHKNFAPQPGDWRVNFDYAAFEGRTEMTFFTVGLPTAR